MFRVRAKTWLGRVGKPETYIYIFGPKAKDKNILFLVMSPKVFGSVGRQTLFLELFFCIENV